MKYMAISDARSQLAKIVGEKQTERIVLTRRGKPKSVLLNWDDFQSLVALVELVGNPEVFKQVLEAHRKFQEDELDEFVDLDSVLQAKA
jgi:prevent-host-death family protein